MDISDFELQVEELQKYLESFGDSTDETDTEVQSEHLQQLKNILASTLEELSVSVEQLKHQNEELSQAHTKLAYERQRYLDLFEFAPDAYIITDKELQVLEVNEAAVDLFNIKKQFFAGKVLSVYATAESREYFCSEVAKLQTPPSIHKFEITLQPRKEHPFPAAISVSPLYEDNILRGWRWLIRDLTAEKQADKIRQALEEQRELSTLKSRFLQMVSHEFRTPLNVIHVSSQLLQKNRDHYSVSKSNQFFSKIQNSVRHMTQMLEDVLVFNKAELNKQGFQPSLVNLEQLCSEIVEEHLLLSKSHCSIDFNFSGSCEFSCFDGKLLKQIVTNLLSNAIKYSHEGGIVRLNLDCTDSEIQMRIEDSGIGIPQKDLEKLFDPFHRATNISNIPGTGLGLAIVKKAVDVHGGVISVSSREGEGTTFHVTLPVKQLEPTGRQLF